MEIREVYDYLANSLKSGDGNAKSILYNLMQQDHLSITDLVKIQEDAFKDKIDEQKGDLSELNAVALMYKDKLYFREDPEEHKRKRNELDDRFIKITRKLGFFNY